VCIVECTGFHERREYFIRGLLVDKKKSEVKCVKFCGTSFESVYMGVHKSQSPGRPGD